MVSAWLEGPFIGGAVVQPVPATRAAAEMNILIFTMSTSLSWLQSSLSRIRRNRYLLLAACRAPIIACTSAIRAAVLSARHASLKSADSLLDMPCASGSRKH